MAIISKPCHEINHRFCYICSKLILKLKPDVFQNVHVERYKRFFNVDNVNLNGSHIGKGICTNCQSKMLKFDRNELDELILSRVEWGDIDLDHSNCFICNFKYDDVRVFKFSRRYKPFYNNNSHDIFVNNNLIIYPANSNVVRLV